MERSPSWRGGRRKTSHGYIDLWLPEHPRARGSGYVLEHVVVWQEHHGELPPGWHIHHINGIKDDNRVENLRAMPSREHMRYLAMQQEELRRHEIENQALRARVAYLEAQLAERGGVLGVQRVLAERARFPRLRGQVVTRGIRAFQRLPERRRLRDRRPELYGNHQLHGVKYRRLG